MVKDNGGSLPDMTGNTLDRNASRLGPTERHSARVAVVSVGKRRNYPLADIARVLEMLGLNSRTEYREDRAACGDRVIGGYRDAA